MNINPDDPKWTAYVLGELNDAERAQIEKELESSAAAREVVEEIRLATDLLRHEFTQEQAVGLAPEQRRAITNAAHPVGALYERPGGRRPPLQFSRPMVRWAGVAASVAAGLLVVATLSVPSLLRSRQDAPLPEAATAPAPVGERKEKDGGQNVKINPTAVSRDKVESARKTAQMAAEVKKLREMQQWQQGQQGQQLQQGQQTGQPSVLGGALPAGSAGGGRSLQALAADRSFFVPAAATPPPAREAGALADRVDRPQFNTEAYAFISE